MSVKEDFSKMTPSQLKMAPVLVVGKRPRSQREGNDGVRRHIDSQLGVGCLYSTYTSGSEGHLDRIYAKPLLKQRRHKGSCIITFRVATGSGNNGVGPK